MVKLSVLVVTMGDPETFPCVRHTRNVADTLGAEFVLVIDGPAAACCDHDSFGRVDSGRHKFLSWIVNDALAYCHGRYVLRIDDDETCSPELAAFLAAEWETGEQYAFPRLNLWADETHALAAAPYYPDWQGRLSVPELARRSHMHEGWTGDVVRVPAPIYHHRYLIRDRDYLMERAAVCEALQPGGGQYAWPEDQRTLPVSDARFQVRTRRKW